MDNKLAFSITQGSETSKELIDFGELSAATLKAVKDKELRDKLELAFKNLKKQFIEENEKQLEMFKAKIKELKMKNEDPKFLVMRDEVIYSMVLTSFLLTVGLLFYPDKSLKFAFILTKVAALMLYRFVDFRRKKWHYYMMEYCYFANLFMILCFIFWRNNKEILAAYFINSMGPVATSFIFFRFTITWHDLSSYTSFFMHYSPVIIAWIMRFHVSEDGYFSTSDKLPSSSDWDQWLSQKGFLGYWEILGYGLLFYVSWMVPYYYIRFHVLDERINRKGNETLFHEAKETSGLYKFLQKKYNPNGNVTLSRVLYMSMHASVSFASFFVSTLLIYSAWLTLLTVAAVTLFSIWSTSVFYLENFVEGYDEKINQIAEQNKLERLEKEKKD